MVAKEKKILAQTLVPGSVLSPNQLYDDTDDPFTFYFQAVKGSFNPLENLEKISGDGE